MGPLTWFSSHLPWSFSQALPWAASLPSPDSVFPKTMSSCIPLPIPLNHLIWDNSFHFLRLLKFQFQPHTPTASWASLAIPLAGPNHSLPHTAAPWHTWTLPSGSFPHLRAQVFHAGSVSGLELRTVRPDSPAVQLQTPTAPTGHPDHSPPHQDLQLEQRQHPAHQHIHGNMRSREGGGVGDGHTVGCNSLLLTLGSQF